MKKRTYLLIAMLFLFVFSSEAFAADEKAPPKTIILFTNANIFDGKNDKPTENMSVLIEDNKIAKIAKVIEAPDGATVIRRERKDANVGPD